MQTLLQARATRFLQKWLQRIPIVRTMIEYLSAVNVAADDGSNLHRLSYEAWQNRFLLARIRLAFGLGLLISWSFAVLDLGRSILRQQILGWDDVAAKLATLIGLLGFWYLSDTRWGARHLRVLFLGFLLSLQVIPETIQVCLSPTLPYRVPPSLFGWAFGFFAQATLVPVRWPLHVLSQVLSLVHSFGLREFLGTAIRSSPIQSRFGLLLELFWICLVCDLSVYLYERLQRAEFNARTKLSEAYGQVEAAEAKYRSIFENAVEGIYQSTVSGQFTSMNPALARIFGYESPEEAIATIKDISALYVEPYRRQQFQAALMADGQVVGFESRICRADGTTTWIAENARAIYNRRGLLMGYEGTVGDVNARKVAEVEVRRALEAERDLSQMKSQFVSMTSHEFRTPLTTILASAEALEHYGERWGPDKSRSYLQRIQNMVHHLTELLESVLILGQADAGRLKFQPTWLDLEQFCAGLVEEMSLNLRQDQTISFQTVDRPAVGRLLELDEKLLRHILSNLLSNALKYSPEGGTVRLRLVYGAETVKLSVQDRGIGIPSADLDRLFESFHRAGNVGTIPGTGLGLTIVQRSIALHGGQIHVTSIEGEGTTFTVTLPTRNAKPLPRAIDLTAASNPPAADLSEPPN
ncbi:MAG: PAS domain-containing sensor histidine kinase [Oscillatoriales cyanobacterium]|nr:MAG: PAS domain-containing sensor histidine kinase [Oscillatoriales cyanobacterium]